MYKETISRKILSVEELDSFVARMRFDAKKIVFTNGCFDILHLGHIQYLQEAADRGDILIVGVNTDASVKKLKGEQRPLQNEKTRSNVLASLVFVDVVVLFGEDTPIDLISQIKPDVLVKGGDYKIEEIVGYKEVKAYGGEVCTIPLSEGYSTTSLLSKI